MRIIVVIPTYNESENIGQLILHILKLHPNFDILVVDDNSPDGTGKVVEELAKQSDRIRILPRPRKYGLGSAYRVGFNYVLSRTSYYDRIIQMDADFSHQPRYLDILLEVTKRKDISIGSRYIEGGTIVNWSLTRRVFSYCANFYVRFWLGIGVKDCTSGFRCFRRDVLANVQFDAIKSNGYLFQIEMLISCLKLGYSFAEVPIVFVDRAKGKSKLGLREVLKAIFQVSKLRFSKYAGDNKRIEKG